MLTGWPGWIAHTAFQAAFLFAWASGTLLMSAPQVPKPILETSFLVFPNKSLAGSGEVPPASNFRATVGKVNYEVRSVSAADDSPDLKTVIVFDLSSIPPDYQPCFIQQAMAMAPNLRRIPNVALFVVSYEWTEFHKPFGYGSGETYEYFLPEPRSAAKKDECKSLPPPRPQFGWSRGWSERPRTDPGFRGGGWERVYGELSTCQSFRGSCGGAPERTWPHPGSMDRTAFQLDPSCTCSHL